MQFHILIALLISLTLAQGSQRRSSYKFTGSPPSASVQNPPPLYSLEPFQHYVQLFAETPTFLYIKPRLPQQIKLRIQVIQRNIDLINTNNRNKKRTYDMEVNEFIFLTSKEFQHLYGSTTLFPQKKSQRRLLPAKRTLT